MVPVAEARYLQYFLRTDMSSPRIVPRQKQMRCYGCTYLSAAFHAQNNVLLFGPLLCCLCV